MNSIMDITYYLHSGFSCTIDKKMLIFDYWLGEHEELQANKRITLEQIKQMDAVYVFISHSHPDHFDPVVYEWKNEGNVKYIISYELPEKCIGTRMNPSDEIQLENDIRVTAYDSTDLGVAFLVDIYGIHIFHAGDLNFWHWREESSADEIDEANEEFKKAVLPIIGKPIDVAFFPVDPRQGRLYDAGANYFSMTVKPRLMIPMHFWGRNELIQEYARRSRSNDTEIMVMTRSGEKIRIEFSEDGYMTINILYERQNVLLTPYNDEYEVETEGNPFSDSDLPVHFDEE